MAHKPRPREVAYTRMQAEIKRAARILEDQGYAASTYIHKNVDGSVDAELRVKPQRGEQVNQIFIDMEDASKPVPTTWVSTGVRYAPRETEEFYTRFMGMSQANAYYQKNTKLATNFVTGRVINTRLQEKGRRKPETVFLRLHWNPENVKPARSRQEKKKRKRKRKP